MVDRRTRHRRHRASVSISASPTTLPWSGPCGFARRRGRRPMARPERLEQTICGPRSAWPKSGRLRRHQRFELFCRINRQVEVVGRCRVRVPEPKRHLARLPGRAEHVDRARVAKRVRRDALRRDRGHRLRGAAGVLLHDVFEAGTRKASAASSENLGSLVRVASWGGVVGLRGRRRESGTRWNVL